MAAALDAHAAFTPHDLRRIAVEAGVDPRTVAAYFAGRPQTSTVKARVARALRALGLA